MRTTLLALLVIALAATAGLHTAPPTTKADGTTAVAIAAGRLHTCALTEGGGVKCWGFGAFGQLGDGTALNPQSRLAPVDVVGLDSGVTTVEGGHHHTCVLTGAGGVKCWGSNNFGQLGVSGVQCFYPDGSPFPCSAEPVDVPDLETGVVAVAPGNFHTCALTGAGEVLCWGNNDVGQLGDGTTNARAQPAPVEGLTSGVQAIAAGRDHTCALTDAGSVRCWGDNRVETLGAQSSETCISVFGDPHACSTTPLDVETLDGGVVALSSRTSHTCALTETGSLKCWGQNGTGELGNGTFSNTPQRTPVEVCADAACLAPLTGVTSIAVGGRHTCAVMEDGGVKCWGSNGFGETGDGNPGFGPENDQFTTPNDVCSAYDADAAECTELLSGATDIASAFNSSCALVADGSVRCWGSNCCGELGVGFISGDRNPLPLAVVGLGAKHEPTPTTTPPPLMGDVNCDGHVTSIDAALVLQFSAALLDELPCPDAADVDGDDQVTSLDAALILQFTAGMLPGL